MLYVYMFLFMKLIVLCTVLRNASPNSQPRIYLSRPVSMSSKLALSDPTLPPPPLIPQTGKANSTKPRNRRNLLIQDAWQSSPLPRLLVSSTAYISRLSASVSSCVHTLIICESCSNALALLLPNRFIQYHCINCKDIAAVMKAA